MEIKDVPEDKVFWVCNGNIIKNLSELNKALMSMNDDTFRYHVNKRKNDFYKWVKDVIGDEALAERLKECENREETAEIIAGVVKNRSYLYKCPYLSFDLDCNVGGFGNLECFNLHFHEKCEHKEKHNKMKTRRRNI